MIYRFALIAVAVLVAACSDPKVANEKNFKVAIQNYLDAVYPRCYFTEDFPATISMFDARGAKATFKALTNAGLLSEKEEPHEVTEIFGRKKVVVQPTFHLTEEGKKFYKTDAVKTLGGKTIGGFCLGKATVKEVSQFSEPSDMFGQRISRVNYTYEVSGLPAWTKSSEILSAISALKADVESEKTPVKKLDALVLTNNGWVHEALFKK